MPMTRLGNAARIPSESSLLHATARMARDFRPPGAFERFAPAGGDVHPNADALRQRAQFFHLAPAAAFAVADVFFHRLLAALPLQAMRQQEQHVLRRLAPRGNAVAKAIDPDDGTLDRAHRRLLQCEAFY